MRTLSPNVLRAPVGALEAFCMLTLSVREPHLCLCKQVGSRPAAELLGGWPEIQPVCYLVHRFPKNKQNLKVLKRRRQYNLFLENYPAFKGLTLYFRGVCC